MGSKLANFGLQAVPVALRDVRRIAHDRIERIRQTFAPAALPEVCPGRQAKSLGIAPRERQRGGAVVDPEPGRPRQLGQQREQQAAGADAEVEQAQRPRAIGQLRQHRLDHGLGRGARDQDRRADLEAQAPELLLAKEVGDRFAREAAACQGLQARPLCGAEPVHPAGHERGAFGPGCSRQQQPGLRARALDAGRGEPRGNLSG